MSENLLALLVTVAIFVAIVAWVPTTDFCHARCQEYLGRRKSRANKGDENSATSPDFELSA
jgi:hypothetical protein